MPSCYTGTPPTSTDCTLWATCFNVNYVVTLTLTVGPGGVPRIVMALTGSDLSIATACAGAVAVPGANDAFEAIFEGQVFDILQDYVDDNVPPLDLNELDFGGIIQLLNLRMMAFGNTFDATFEDTFGLTCDPAPPP